MTATSVLSNLGYAGLRAAGIPALARKIRPGGVILAYHNVVRTGHTWPLGDPGAHLTAERFAEQMRWIAGRYTVVPLSEFVSRVHAGLPLRGLLALTFDDGYLGCLQTALPILRDRGFPAALFVVADAPGRDEPFWWDQPAIVRELDPATRERYLVELRGEQRAILGHLDPGALERVPNTLRAAGWAELAAAQDAGFEIGAHSMHHHALTTLTDRELAADLAGCRAALADRLGRTPDHFAYPYGRWDARIRAAVRAAGFTAAVTLDGGTNSRGGDPWALSRINIPASIGHSAFACWAAGIHPPRGAQ